MLPDVKRLAAVLLLVVALPAAGEFTVIEETDTMTVYRDGDHVIVLADVVSLIRELSKLAMSRSNEAPFLNNVKDKASSRAGTPLYLSRIRLLNGELVCEKIAARPALEFRAYVVAQIAASPCGQRALGH